MIDVSFLIDRFGKFSKSSYSSFGRTGERDGDTLGAYKAADQIFVMKSEVESRHGILL